MDGIFDYTIQAVCNVSMVSCLVVIVHVTLCIIEYMDFGYWVWGYSLLA